LAVVARGAQYDGTTFVPTAASPVNIIFGSNQPTITASSIVSGSNNIIANLRTANTNAAEIIANNAYISVFPSTRTPAYAPVQIANSNVNSLITVTNNSVGLSSSLALGVPAFGYGTAATIVSSNILTQVTLNPNSSSTSLNSVLNAGNLTVNGNKVGPDFTSATGSGFGNNNTINVGSTTLFDRASGSYNAGSTTFSRNLYGGVITVTNPSTATASAALQNTIAFGSNLIVTGSDNPASANNGGSAFFGRYNLNDGTINNTSNVVFAVGAGTGTGASTRTPLWVGTNQSVNITGSLLVYNSDSSKLSIDSNAVVSGSKFYAGNSNEGLAYGLSTGSLSNSYTRYGRDGFQIYQYQGQPYAFGVICTADQLNQYTGSQFRWGTVNSLGPIQNYMNMISASYTGSIGSGTPIPGFDYLKDGEIVQFQRGVTFDNNVYIQKGLYVSQSAGGGVPALTLNGSGGGGGALLATGSCVITGSLTLNGVNITSTTLSAGAFYSSITQSGSANVSQSMTFNNTDITEGVSVNSNSQLTVTNSGTYNIQFSAQVDRISGSGTDTVHIWLKKNGSVVSNSAGAITVSGGASAAKAIASWNYVVNANANDYFELVWQSTDSNIELTAFTSSGNIPAIPSVIATVTQVN
jgi:hypothetical protein